MSRKRAIIKGTFILTLTGFATRFMGFFYRIFLSHTFGEEGVGLYQLIFPIYALCFSLTSAGIEIALSRCVAKRTTLGQEKEARELLYTSIIFTVIISCITTLLLQKYAWFISSAFLKDERCAELLVILSYAFPFAAVHSCICGYYFGLKMTGVPATSQLIEQVARIMSVYLIYVFGQKNGITFGISIAVAGLIAGEVVSSLFCLRAITGKSMSMRKIRPGLPSFGRNIRELLFLSVPLTGSRVLLNVLQSVEAISIPLKLQAYGMTNKAALSTYGVLTGFRASCFLPPSPILSQPCSSRPWRRYRRSMTSGRCPPSSKKSSPAVCCLEAAAAPSSSCPEAGSAPSCSKARQPEVSSSLSPGYARSSIRTIRSSASSTGSGRRRSPLSSTPSACSSASEACSCSSRCTGSAATCGDCWQASSASSCSASFICIII